MFCYRNRPFAVLQSSFLPTPTSTYIDHQLVMELGMKMSEVSCKKISFAGKKLRLLGRVSFSAQCVNDGSIFGSYHFKASVIENLQQHFDTHGIAGSRMTNFLNGDDDYTSSSSNSSTSSPTRPARRPPQARTSETPPARTPAPPAPPARPSAPPPPGFPYRSRHPPPPDAPSQVPDSFLNKPILMNNLILLNQMFGGADRRNDVDDERTTLEYVDEEGAEDHSQDKFTFVMSDDTQYQTGHGRDKCRHDVCSSNWEVPANCGFAADQWQFPDDFRPCSAQCRGGFCQCINHYI